ncbi:MAG: hypothetical protein ABI723_05010 [Bacteroidia bacterium]
MIFKNRIREWLIIILSLLAIQILSYHFVGQHGLKDKLLPDYFATLTHHADSVFVQDFVVSECGNDLNIYLSHNLKDDKDVLKKKLNVHYIYFQTKENWRSTDSLQSKFNLVYFTCVERPKDFGLFWARQTEVLLIDKKQRYERRVNYRWCLFFWIETFEFMESSEVNSESHPLRNAGIVESIDRINVYSIIK